MKSVEAPLVTGCSVALNLGAWTKTTFDTKWALRNTLTETPPEADFGLISSRTEEGFWMTWKAFKNLKGIRLPSVFSLYACRLSNTGKLKPNIDQREKNYLKHRNLLRIVRIVCTSIPRHIKIYTAANHQREIKMFWLFWGLGWDCKVRLRWHATHA